MDSLKFLKRLACLSVPDVNFRMLAQLSAGSKSAAADVFVSVALNAISVWTKLKEGLMQLLMA